MFLPRRSIHRSIVAAALAFSIAQAATAMAGETVSLSARSRPISVAVIGDSVANDLGRGMEALFGNKPHMRIVKETKFATGLVRTDYFDWNDTVRDFLRHNRPDAIVVVIGGNDKQPIRIGGERLDPLTRPWLAEYEKRVAHFMDNFRRSRAKVFWVGLPEVRLETLNENYRAMNAIYKREAARHRFKYISIWEKFRTKDGAYSSFGQSLEGVTRRIRKDDGMHFTEAGRLLFAAYVAKAIGLR